MNPGADRLPGEVLEKIFSYLPCEDLLESVQFVCTWWQQVSWEKSLWKYIMYYPDGRGDSVIEMLEKAPQLRILNLRSATVDNDLIQFITDSCPNLEHLSIHWDSIYNNADVTITRPLSQIKILSFFWFPNSSLDFSYLDSAFPNLESLDIAKLIFNKRDIESYLEKKQDSLHTLSISCCIRDKHCVLPCLSVCTKLRHLSLYEVCDKLLSSKKVGHLANISHLTLHDSDVSNVNDSSPVFCSFPNITTLVLDSCTNVTENVVRVIARNCPQLQKLKFSSYCQCSPSSINLFRQEIPIEDILQDAIHLERLTHLCFHHAPLLTDEDIEHVLRQMPQLIHLDLYECVSVTTGCLKLICGFSNLEELKFDLHNRPLPADLRASDVKNKNLQLMFYNCPHVSSLESLRQQHLSVCLTGYSSCKICCSHKCQKVFCTCWIERYNCFMDCMSLVMEMELLKPFPIVDFISSMN